MFMVKKEIREVKSAYLTNSQGVEKITMDIGWKPLAWGSNKINFDASVKNGNNARIGIVDRDEHGSSYKLSAYQ